MRPAWPHRTPLTKASRGRAGRQVLVPLEAWQGGRPQSRPLVADHVSWQGQLEGGVPITAGR